MKPATFRHHSSRVQAGDGPKWVAASGVEGLESVTIKLADESAEERAYTVRLHFVEPRHQVSGRRAFSVKLQGREVLSNCDIVQEAGGRARAVVREFKGVQVKGDLVVTFQSKAGTPLICGIEVLAEGW